ncbi:MAG: insulinase family protein, partial [Methylophilaceae bacterium]|nr:insulinase family protein [Methylophilaceae bacterium]
MHVNMLNLSKITLLATGLLFSIASFAGVKIEQWQTSTGAEVYFVENRDLPIIDISINFAAGSARDTADKAG